LFVEEPEGGNGVAAGVADPSIEYVAALRDAPVRFTIMRKK